MSVTFDTVQTLLDRDEIREIRAQFAWGLDTRDWDLVSSVFTEEVDVDLPALGAPSSRISRADLVALFQHFFQRSRAEMGTQQLYGNVVIDLDGDTATSRSCFLGHHHVPGMVGGEDASLRATYHDRLVRTDEGWKIAGTTIEVQSIVGNAAIFA